MTQLAMMGGQPSSLQLCELQFSFTNCENLDGKDFNGTLKIETVGDRSGNATLIEHSENKGCILKQPEATGFRIMAMDNTELRNNFNGIHMSDDALLPFIKSLLILLEKKASEKNKNKKRNRDVVIPNLSAHFSSTHFHWENVNEKIARILQCCLDSII